MPSARRLLAGVLLVGLFAISAQAQAQDISIVPTLRAGDSFQLEVIRIREHSTQPLQNLRARTVIDVRVISANADGFVLEWVPGAAVLISSAAPNPLLGIDTQALRDTRFRLKLSADGELQGVANEAEVAPKLKTAVDDIVRQVLATIPEAERKVYLDFIRQTLSVDLLIATAIRDATIYFGLNGATLSVGEAVEFDLEQPNPFGVGTLPATFRVRMDSASADRASLSSTTTYDSAALMRTTVAVAKQVGTPIPPEELAALPTMTMADEATYVFDRALGLMREVKASRLIAYNPTTRLEAWEIRLIDGR